MNILEIKNLTTKLATDRGVITAVDKYDRNVYYAAAPQKTV